MAVWQNERYGGITRQATDDYSLILLHIPQLRFESKEYRQEAEMKMKLQGQL